MFQGLSSAQSNSVQKLISQKGNKLSPKKGKDVEKTTACFETSCDKRSGLQLKRTRS